MKCTECGSNMKKTKGNYNYRESGIDKVNLQGIPIYVCKCGHEIPSILHVEQLHELIAIDVVKQKRLLMGQEVRFLRKAMGLKAVDLAKILNVTKVTVSRWESDDSKIGDANDKLLRLLYLDKKGLLQRIMKNVQSVLETTTAAEPVGATPPIYISAKELEKYHAGIY